MKKETINNFSRGLNVDLHPMVTPNSVLTDDLNGTFITYNGNEFCLQNDKGNFEVAQLSDGYIPIGAKEYNGIIYIVSVKNEYKKDKTTGEYIVDENGNYIIDPTVCETEIGTYPGVDWSVPYEKECNLITPEYKPEGKECYTVLQNIDVVDDEENNIATSRGKFSGLHLGYSTVTPVTIEIQPSYDGSVNLILTDGVNPVRMINSGFSVLPNDKYKLIKRNQSEATNNYHSGNLDEFGLIRTTNVVTNIDLETVQSGGQLKGGNYTFYIKFGDSDYNQTDVVAESGIVSIFKGTDCVPSTISGTVLDERTDKMICLRVEGINRTYSKIYIYYSREYSDTLGYRLTEYGVLKDPIDITGDTQNIWISGFEQTETINSEEIKIDYHTVDSARAITQQQNMLFLGNLGMEETYSLYRELKSIASSITPSVKQKSSMTGVDFDYNKNISSDELNSEYYSTQNIYNYVGYWPDEWYRFGIVFILKDGSTTPVFNMRGGIFDSSGKLQLEDGEPTGVFKTPKWSVFNGENIRPIYFEFKLELGLPDNVIGYFYVRQKRIPTTLCQGITLGIDTRSHLPVTWNGKRWITQSFLSLKRKEEDTPDDSHRFYLKPLLQYTSGKTSESTTISSGSAYSGYIKGGLVYVETTIVDSLAALNEQYTIYDKDDSDLDTASQIYVYKFQYYWRLAQGPNGYQLVTPAQSSLIVHFYYVSTKDISNLPNVIWLTKQESGPFYWANDFNKALIGARALNTQKDAKWRLIGSGQPIEFANKYIVYPSNITEEKINSCALLSLDPCVVSTIRNVLDGSEFNLQQEFNTETYFGKTECDDNLKGAILNDSITNIFEKNNTQNVNNLNNVKCVFIPSNTKIKEMDGIGFSNVAGEASDVKQYSYASYPFGVSNEFKKTRSGSNNNGDQYRYVELTDAFNTTIENKMNQNDLSGQVGYNSVLNVNIIRGLFTPFVGTNASKLNHGLWSIRIKTGNDEQSKIIRQQDESSYYTISKRKDKNDIVTDVYRGDCFTNTVSMRILRNFIDPDVPISDNIVDFTSWDHHVRRWGDKGTTEGDNNMDYIEWDQVNRADVNTVDLGYWVTYKCLSSYNLGLRSEDRFHEQELSLLGSPRSFYPINGGSTATGNKMEESFLLNDGYSATVGEKTYDLLPDVPYFKSEFANRIIFSNVQVDDSFTNGYRTFQGLSYQDYDKQYGEIVKLIPWDNNLLVVMEHGIGVVGVNEQALLQTSTADTIHIYGHGVLSDHMQMISQDYGSKYEHSVIRTPIGVYGIDTDARKIWRVSTQKGFETLSDMKIESYLNDELGTNVSNDLPLIDVRTHYNATKGDIMFTFFKKLFKKQPKTVAPVEERKYFNIVTSTIEESINETKTRSFSTNYSAEEISASIDDPEIAEVSLDFDKKVLSVKGLEGGGSNIKIAGKTVPVEVRTAEQDKAIEQKQIAEITGTEITTETQVDEETGEEKVVPVVVSRMDINTSILQTLYVGETYNMYVTFKNNPNNVTLSDCNVEIFVKDGTTMPKTAIVGNTLQITPLSAGEWRYKITYPGARGIESGWKDIKDKVFWVNLNGVHGGGDTVEIEAAIGSYFELAAYGQNTGDVTLNIEDTNIVTGGVTKETDRIWHFANKVGTTRSTITDTGSGDTVTVILKVIDCINIETAKYYLDDEEITSLTMHPGETKTVTWKYLPEYHPGNTVGISGGLYKDKPDVYDREDFTHIQTANASYNIGHKRTSISALKTGTIEWRLAFSSPVINDNKIWYATLPITVVNE